MAVPAEFMPDFDGLIREAQGERSRTQQRGRLMVIDGVIPIFHKREVVDKAASLAAGREVMRWEDWIEIKVPGQRDCVIGPARADHKLRFAEAWESYQRADNVEIVGTSILEWAGISRIRAAELRAAQVYTVEQLAELSDGVSHRVGPDFNSLKSRAKEFIAERQALKVTSDELAQVRQELAGRDSLISELESRLAALERAGQGSAPAANVPDNTTVEGAGDAVDSKGRSASRRG